MKLAPKLGTVERSPQALGTHEKVPGSLFWADKRRSGWHVRCGSPMGVYPWRHRKAQLSEVRRPGGAKDMRRFIEEYAMTY